MKLEVKQNVARSILRYMSDTAKDRHAHVADIVDSTVASRKKRYGLSDYQLTRPGEQRPDGPPEATGPSGTATSATGAASSTGAAAADADGGAVAEVENGSPTEEGASQQ